MDVDVVDSEGRGGSVRPSQSTARSTQTTLPSSQLTVQTASAILVIIQVVLNEVYWEVQSVVDQCHWGKAPRVMLGHLPCQTMPEDRSEPPAFNLIPIYYTIDNN